MEKRQSFHLPIELLRLRCTTHETCFEKPQTQRNIRSTIRAQRIHHQNSRAHNKVDSEKRADGNRVDKKKAVNRVPTWQGVHEEFHARISGTTKNWKTHSWIFRVFRLRVPQENRKLRRNDITNPSAAIHQDIDFSEVANYVEAEKQKKANMTPEEKKQLAAERKVKREELKKQIRRRRSRWAKTGNRQLDSWAFMPFRWTRRPSAAWKMERWPTWRRHHS